MARPITLFTGQWADLPLAELAPKASRLGLRRAGARLLGRSLRRRRGAERARLLRRAVARCSSSTVSAATRSARTSSARPSATRSTRATARILPPEVWGDGDPEGVRQRAAERLKDTARAAAAFGVTVVNGFTGSPIWHQLYSFPPNDFEAIDRGYQRVRGALRARSSMSSKPRACASRSRSTRPRSPTTSSRPARRSPRSAAARLRDQFRPEPLHPPVARPGGVRRRVRRPDLPRACQGLEAAARRPRARSSAPT